MADHETTSAPSPSSASSVSSRRPLTVVFVCLGNICRSPMAAVVLRHRLEEHGLADAVRVDSAGIGDWHIGRPADARARATLTAHGYGTEHVAAQVGPHHLDADLLLAADSSHVDALRARLGPDRADRVRLLRSFDATAPEGAEVPDPYHGDDEAFVDVLRMIERSVDGLVEWVRRNR